MKNPLLHIILYPMILLVISCGPVRDNPFDPENTDFTFPLVYIDTTNTNVKNNDTLASDSIVISWIGNNESCVFSSQLDGLLKTPWSKDNTKFSGYLDDGSHVFRISVCYQGGIDTTFDSLSFYINALAIPAVYVFPREQTVTSDTADITVRTKGMPQCYIMHLVISGPQIASVEKIHGKDDENVNIFYDTATHTIDMIVIPDGAPISGDSEVIAVTFVNISNETEFIDFSECVVSDSSNLDINVTTIRGGYVRRSSEK